MELITQGKTKDIYLSDSGNYILKFKDDVTGEGGVFDPGANKVGLIMEGAARASFRLSTYFFEILEKEGIASHFVKSNFEDYSMEVRRAELFGQGLEIICRYRAVGSFIRRYGKYAKEGQSLDGLIEVTLKDDERNDPLITRDALIMLGILKEEEYDELIELTIKSCEIIRKKLLEKGLELYDIKLEFGLVEGKIVLIDEVSGGNMRVFRDDRYIEPLELESILLDE